MSIAMIRNDQQVLQNTREPMNPDWYRLIRDLVSAVNRTTVPVNGVVWCNLTAQDITDYFDADGRGLTLSAYDGWHICNGNNSTPSLASKFLRSSVTAAGGTGGSDSSAHTHAVDPASFTSGAGTAHTHSTPAHKHVVPIGADGSNFYADRDNTAVRSVTNRAYVAITADGPANIRVTDTDTDGSGTSGSESAHTHAIDVPSTTSGAASATENRPAYYELVPLIRTGAA